jgi:uncharacterized protein (DUF2249 family)
MTVESQLPGDMQRSAGLAGGTPLTLADEHVLLLWQVTARAGELQTAVARGQWPAAELASLADYARAEVVRQASEEESLLFPVRPPPTTARLARDHARLRAGAELLTRAAAGDQPFSPGQLAAAARDFVDQLEYHMSAEEKLLGSERAVHSVPAVAALGGHPHTWYPLTEGPVIDLDALPPGQATAAAVDRLLRMRHGEQVELQSSADISPVWREMDQLSPGGYSFISLEDGPGRWRMRVTRRQAED